MSKNMTQKGLALGAGVALVVSSFAALPASAAGIDNGAVRLTPNAGTTYNMLAAQPFDLKSNFAQSAETGGSLKYLVEATTGAVKFDVDVNGLTTGDSAYVLTRPITSASTASGVTTTTVVAEAHGFSTGDKVTFTGTFEAATGTAKDFTAAGYAETAVTVVDADTFTFVSGADAAAAGAITATSAKATFVSSAVSAASVTSNVLSVTVANGRHYMVGDVITVSGVTLSAGTTAAANADHTITAISGNVLSAALTNADATSTLSSAKAVLKTPASNTSLSSRTVITGSPLGEGRITGATPTYTSGTNKFVVDTADSTAGGVDAILRLVATDATVTTTAAVTAWVDDNDNDLIDTTEYQSPARTVTFLPNTAVTFNTAFDKPLLAATSVSAMVTISPDVNLAQIADGVVEVDFLLAAATIDADNVDANYDEDEEALVATDSSIDTIAGGSANPIIAGVYSAQAQYDGLNRGAIVYQTTVASTKDVSSVDAAVTAASASTAGSAIKTGTTAVSFSAQGYIWGAYAGGGGTEIAAPAGIPAVVTITKSVLATASTIVAGGKTLKSTGTSISFDAVTNADGEVVFDIVATGAKNDSIKVDVKLEDSDTAGTGTAAPSSFTNGYKAASQATFTWADAAATTLVDVDTLGGSATRGIAKGGTATVNYQLVDQFGQPIAAERRFVFAITGTTAGQVEASAAQYVVSSTGSASVTVSDVSTALTGTYALGATVQKKDLSGNWTSETGSATTNFVMGTKAVASVTTTTAMTSADAAKTLQTVAVKVQDGRKAALSAFPYATSSEFTITGYVKAADGSGIAGQAVTISSAGAGFSTSTSSTSGTYTADSITVYTTSGGQYTVYAYSNKSGTVTYSVTSGSASASTSAIYAAPAKTAGKTLVVDAPVAAGPGTTFKVTATLTDKFGNPVYTNANGQIRVSYDGPGIVVATLPTDTNTLGQISFAVLLGTNDYGTATATVSYDMADDDDFTGTTVLDADLVVSKSILVGTAAVSSWTKNLNDGTVKMYAKNIVGAGKVQFMLNGEEIAWVRATSAADSKLRTANGASYLVRTVDLVEGQKNVLEIYVDGVRTTRTAYTY